MLVILATQEAEFRKITIRSQHGPVRAIQSQKHPTQKNRAGGVAQVVVHLPSKCEAPSSNPRTAKKKKKKKKKEIEREERVQAAPPR
jgi:hypothetical protein